MFQSAILPNTLFISLTRPANRLERFPFRDADPEGHPQVVILCDLHPIHRELAPLLAVWTGTQLAIVTVQPKTPFEASAARGQAGSWLAMAHLSPCPSGRAGLESNGYLLPNPSLRAQVASAVSRVSKL